MTMERKSLHDRVKEFGVRLPFMEGREAGEAKDVLNVHLTIRDYGFLKNDEGEDYVAFIVDERPKHFYYGGTVLTDRMQQLEIDGYHDEVAAEGLPVLMTIKKSKNKREYTNVEFYPD